MVPSYWNEARIRLPIFVATVLTFRYLLPLTFPMLRRISILMVEITWMYIKKVDRKRKEKKQCPVIRIHPDTWIHKAESFSEAFTNWITRSVQGSGIKTLALDGKTIRSTEKMKGHENPIHIVSAQPAEYGVTIGQITVEGKSNEIPAVQKLIDFLDIKGCMIVADALNCQKEIAKR